MKTNQHKQSFCKPKSIIKYYDPYIKLNFRAETTAAFHLESLRTKYSSSIDMVAVLQAFMKRNGYLEVKKRNRTEEIRLSLSFYPDQDYLRVYQEFLLPHEKMILKHIKSSLSVNYEPFIEQHLLPVGHHNGYYQLSNQEMSFARDHFTFLDEYFSLKTLVCFGCNLNKLNSGFIEKYYKLKKWVYLHQNGQLPKPQELSILNLPNQSLRSHLKICIVGINLPNLILAHKLSVLGAKVMVVDSSPKKINQTKERYLSDYLKQGIYIGNEGENVILRKTLQQYIGMKPVLLQQHQPPQQEYSQFNNASYNNYVQQSMLSILEEITNEQLNNHKKLLYQQLMNKVLSRNSISSQQRYYRNQYGNSHNIIDTNIMRIHLQRYIMFNKLKDEQTLTTSDLKKCLEMYYEANNSYSKIKMGLATEPMYIPQIFPKQSPCHITQILNNSTQSANLYVNLQSKFVEAELQNKKWIITFKSTNEDEIEFTQQFSHLVYGAELHLQKALNSKSYILPDIKGMIVEEGFPILQQLSSHHQIHCLYIFNENVTFKSVITPNMNYFSPCYTAYISEYGIIHFIILNSNKQVLATLRFNKKFAYVDFYKQIFVILTSSVLANSPQILLNQELMEESVYFSLRDEIFFENLIKAREQEKLYFSLPVITSCGHRNILQAHLAANNKILGCIFKNIEKTPEFYQINVPQLQELILSKPTNIITPQQKDSINSEHRIYQAKKVKEGDSKKHYSQKYYQRKQQKHQQRFTNKQLSKSRQKEHKQHSEVSLEDKMLHIQSNREESREYSRKVSNEQLNLKRNRSAVSIKDQKMAKDQKSCEDFFGIKSSLIKQYSNQISEITENYRKLINGFKISEGLYNMGNRAQKLASGISHANIYPNLFLYHVGHPKLTQNLTRNKTTLSYVNLNGLITRRQYYSLVDTQIMTVYYQCVVIVDGVQYFCMVDQVVFHNHAEQIQKQMLYYHTNLEVLQQKFNSVLKSVDNTLNLSQQIFPTLLNGQSLYILPEHIFPSVIQKLIRKELKTVPDLDTLLGHKLKGKSMIADTCYTLYQESPSMFIFEQIKNYLQSILTNNKIKNFSVSDIFFGKLDSLFMFNQMIGMFGRNVIDQQVEEIGQLAKKINHEKKYPLEIRYNAKSKNITISRMFLNYIREEQNFMRVYEIKEADNSEWLHQYYTTNLYNNKVLQQIIKKCLERFRSYQIINYFKDLIYHELIQSQKLKDDLLQYYKMTRVLNLPPMIEQTTHFLSEAKTRLMQSQTTEQLDQMMLKQNYQSGNVKMIGNDIICLK